VNPPDAANRSSDEAPPAPDQATLIASLRNPAIFGQETGAARVDLVETHISYVLLTGTTAFKIKKAVNLQFLDFSTLAKRRYYCDEELRLNRPLAPSVYLDVVAITGTAEAPVIGGDGPVLEYALKMRQFGQDGLLSQMLARGALTGAHIDRLAGVVAAFHGSTGKAAADAPYGRLDDILQPALENFTQLLTVVDEPADRVALESLRDWTASTHGACAPLFLFRRRQGFVRECHGDLHLGNIALIDGELTLFDRLEFNESMRWTDVMNDVAFIVADLQEHRRPDLAARFLSAYLEATGDYAGLGVLRFYLVYRAMVRAKVAYFRMRQLDSPARENPRAEYRAFLDLARRDTEPRQGAIIITHGLSGSGKTTCAETVVEQTSAIRIRTDVERKRLHGLVADASSGSRIREGLYSGESTRRTYTDVCALARGVAASGYVVIVDGAFLQHWQREMFREAAAALGVPFVILAVSASEATLRERIARRRQRGGDASEATVDVLDAQLDDCEPPTPDEQPFVVRWNTDAGLALPATPILDALQRRITPLEHKVED
jgi:aminoglycoside phosphotransferase family enzyme/predicted kinase